MPELLQLLEISQAFISANIGSTIITVLALIVWRYRDFIFGRSVPKLYVEPPKEASLTWKGTAPPSSQILKLQNEGNPKLINCFDPCTGFLMQSGSATVMTAEEVRTLIGKARVAQRTWKKTTFAQRRELLKLLLDYVVKNQELICRVASRDTGKTMVDGSFGEVLTTCEKLQWTIDHGEDALRPEYRGVGAIMMHKQASVEYVPLGVLGAIIPWNYPFHNMLGQVISALFAGNAIVIKVSEHACWSSEFYGRIVKEALACLGHSSDLVQVVTGFGATGSALTQGGVDKLTFIGSPEVGRLVMRDAAPSLTPVLLELGGKDAAIVCDDCDFNQVVQLSLRGTFQNCGQNCIGLERLVVHSKIYDRTVAELTTRVKALTQGPPMEGEFDCGAMTMGPSQIAGIQALVDDAIAKGAKLVSGGKINPNYPTRSFYLPTLLVDVTTGMMIAQKEVFGPVMVVFKANDDNDAIRIANSCEYGLGSSVFTLNKARAEHIVSEIRTGMCNVNDFGVNYLCQALPFGGVKISGFDRFAGVEGLRGCCLVRSITRDRIPGVRTTIPGPLQYPVKASGFEFSKNLIQMMYGNGIWERLQAALSLAKIGMQGK